MQVWYKEQEKMKIMLEVYGESVVDPDVKA